MTTRANNPGKHEEGANEHAREEAGEEDSDGEFVACCLNLIRLCTNSRISGGGA